jgi:hypothetical protein
MVLVLANAGIIIPISSAITGNEAGGMIIPAMARPLPFSWPELLLIFTKATIPKIIAGITVTRQVKGVRIPSTNEVIANPLVLASGLEGRETLVRTQLQNWHSWALLGFSLPHFGQFICVLLFRFPFRPT